MVKSGEEIPEHRIRLTLSLDKESTDTGNTSQSRSQSQRRNNSKSTINSIKAFIVERMSFSQANTHSNNTLLYLPMTVPLCKPTTQVYTNGTRNGNKLYIVFALWVWCFSVFRNLPLLDRFDIVHIQNCMHVSLRHYGFVHIRKGLLAAKASRTDDRTYFSKQLCQIACKFEKITI